MSAVHLAAMGSIDGVGDAGLAAFWRLLGLAQSSPQAQVDAIVALSQRTVFCATWPDGQQLRTLISSNGMSALPAFTHLSLLTEAATRLGWVAPDGTLPHREVGAREAFGAVVQQALHFLIVDFSSPHSLELQRTILETTLRAPRRGNDEGPFAGTGKLSSTLIRAVREASDSIRPDALSAATAPSAPPAAPVNVALDLPSDACLTALEHVLREYPEVEWAAWLSTTPTTATIAIRISPAFRSRESELSAKLQATAATAGYFIETRSLLEASDMREARTQGRVFYPWRK